VAVLADGRTLERVRAGAHGDPRAVHAQLPSSLASWAQLCSYFVGVLRVSTGLGHRPKARIGWCAGRHTRTGALSATGRRSPGGDFITGGTHMHMQGMHGSQLATAGVRGAATEGAGQAGGSGSPGGRSTPLRVDAQRNLEHVLRAAREV